MTIRRRSGNGGAEDGSFALKYTITGGSGTFSPITANNQSKRPIDEGALDELTLTASNSGNVFNFTLPEDSLRKNKDSGTPWEYYVVESEVPLYVTSYGTATTEESVTTCSVTPGASDAKDGEVIVNQTFGGYELPSTGGPGTSLLYLPGSLLIMLGYAGFILNQRKKRAE